MMSKGMRQTTHVGFFSGFQHGDCELRRATIQAGTGGLAGAGLGAASGAIIGSTVGRAGAGALIGGPIGLLAGALVGDQLMAQDKGRNDSKERSTKTRPSWRVYAEKWSRLRRENERLKER